MAGNFWDTAFVRSPIAARWLYGGFLLLAVASLVMAWKVSFPALAATALLVLVSSIVVALAVKGLSRTGGTALSQSLLWGLMLFVAVFLSLFMLAAFFGVPRLGTILVARMLNLPELVTGDNVDNKQLIPPVNGTWPAESTAPLDVGGDLFVRLEALRRRPSLRLTPEHQIQGGGTVYVNTLDLKGDVVVTGGKDLTIEAIKIISEGGVVRSHERPDTGSRTGSTTAGKLTLIVHDRIVGKLTVDLSGRPGGPGDAGQPGPQGGRGSQGDNAASGLFDCQRGPERGGDGGAGQSGEDGKPGGDGEPGGILEIAGSNPSAIQASIVYALSGGSGGRGGTGGRGGDGGPPGPGGSSNGNCNGTGPSGSQGARGADGRSGAQGKPGIDGKVSLRTLDSRGVPL